MESLSMPAFFGGKLYFGPVGHNILAFQFKNAQLLPAPVAQTSNSFGYPGATPSVSANNGRNGIVWASANTNPVASTEQSCSLVTVSAVPAVSKP